MLKMLLFIICEAPQKISTIFRSFLAIVTLFHLKNWPYLQKPQYGNLAKTRFWFLLVNNSLCSIPLSWTRSYIKETPGDRCEYSTVQHLRPAVLYQRQVRLQLDLLVILPNLSIKVEVELQFRIPVFLLGVQSSCSGPSIQSPKYRVEWTGCTGLGKRFPERSIWNNTIKNKCNVMPAPAVVSLFKYTIRSIVCEASGH